MARRNIELLLLHNVEHIGIVGDVGAGAHWLRPELLGPHGPRGAAHPGAHCRVTS